MEKKFRIAAVGDNCIDYYDASRESFPGGNPVNVAVYIKRLGGDASYTGAVGTDHYGEIIADAIVRKGVDISHLKKLDGETAVSHVSLVDGNRVFGEYNEGVLKDFSLNKGDIDFICGHDIVVTGIWGMIENNVEEISHTTPVAFDFANKFCNEIVDIAIPHVAYAFFSYDEECHEDFDRKCDSMGIRIKNKKMEQLFEFMKCMKSRGPKVVIVTLGDKGSIAYDGENYYNQDIINCDVIDTMGAGDSYIAGFIYAMLEGKTIQQAMKQGAENSAITLGYFGAW